MAKCYPEIIPEPYAQDDKLTDAYKRGWNHGHGIACHNVPTVGQTYYLDGEGKVHCDADNAQEVHSMLCHAAADNARCYSPFEFTAHEFNSAETDEEGNWDADKEGTSEALWEAFEEGTGDAIAADVAEYGPEAYGVEEEAA